MWNSWAVVMPSYLLISIISSTIPWHLKFRDPRILHPFCCVLLPLPLLFILLFSFFLERGSFGRTRCSTRLLDFSLSLEKKELEFRCFENELEKSSRHDSCHSSLSSFLLDPSQFPLHFQFLSTIIFIFGLTHVILLTYLHLLNLSSDSEYIFKLEKWEIYKEEVRSMSQKNLFIRCQTSFWSR